MNEDHQRIDWLENVAEECVLTIVCAANGTFEVTVGRVVVPGSTLRDALDTAMGIRFTK